MTALLTLIVLLQTAPDAATFDDPARSILWAHTWDRAYAQARLRNVPLFVFLTSDN